MTHRERLERKLEKRQDWALKAEARANSAYDAAHRIASFIPSGQPILVGHHSEKRHRQDLDRIDSNMRKSIDNADLSKHHESKAAGIEHALDRSIFSDDDNAIEALEARIAEHEAKREQMKTVNKLYRKGDAEGLAALGIDLTALKTKLAAAGPYWGKAPHLPYEMSNLGGGITTDRKRLEYLKEQKARSAKAEESPNGVTLEQCSMGYVRVTFAEKPSRDILNSLRSAGFHWGGGSWAGKGENLPEEVKAMLTPAMACQQCGLETIDVRKRFDGLQLCDLCDSEPTYSNQLRKARELLATQGREALDNPHGMIGRTCSCGTCFCCAAVEVLRGISEAPQTSHG